MENLSQAPYVVLCYCPLLLAYVRRFFQNLFSSREKAVVEKLNINAKPCERFALGNKIANYLMRNLISDQVCSICTKCCNIFLRNGQNEKCSTGFLARQHIVFIRCYPNFLEAPLNLSCDELRRRYKKCTQSLALVIISLLTFSIKIVQCFPKKLAKSSLKIFARSPTSPLTTRHHFSYPIELGKDYITAF